MAAALLAAAPAHATEIQKSGPQLFPGKLQVGVTVIGFQAGFVNQAPSGYKLTADIAGLIASPGKLSLWLGGGMNYAFGFFGCYVTDCGGDLVLWAFVILTVEKLLKIALVPVARAGVGGDLVFSGDVAAASLTRFGGGPPPLVSQWLA